MSTPHTRLLLDTWRQVSEHLDIAACVDVLQERVARDLPVRRLVVRRLDALHGALDTVAVAPWTGPVPDAFGRRVLQAEERAALEAWCRRGRVEVPPRAVARLVSSRDPVGRTAVAGGLIDGAAVVGVLWLELSQDPSPHLDVLSELLAPVVVALRNDHRIHELARLTEAAEADNRALLSRLARDGLGGPIVGFDGGLREVMLRVDRVGPTDAPVLVLGETGTGKELVAREIHARSARARGPFLKVNCGAIPPDLVDSELFGHQRGSFTGAVADRSGWFERADGGTLFLDEIGELPPAAQVRMLRVLQDGTFERVGGQRPLHADVRIVAATHRDLQEMVGSGRFREDLWYRIGVFPLRLPPLRERPGDLPALAAHFAARAGERLFGRPLGVGPDDLVRLAAYAWPGNVRELGAVIERAAILGDGQRLDLRTALGVQTDAAPVRLDAVAPVRTVDPQPTLAEVNRRAIREVLEACRGQVEGETGAARRLGVSPSTLRSRMERLGVDWRSYR